MDELISRRAAIDALARMMPRSYTPDGSHPADEEIFRAQEVFADCIEVLEILPSAQPDLSGYSDNLWRAAYERGKAEAEQRWIPVEERLPENEKRVLVTIPLVNGYPWVKIARYGTMMFEHKVCFYESDSEWGDCEISGVTAWMPLPESYRGGENG